MGPNGFMGKTLLELQIKSSFQRALHNRNFLRPCIPKRSNGFSFLGDKLTTSFVQGTSEISTVKEHSHIAIRHLEIM